MINNPKDGETGPVQGTDKGVESPVSDASPANKNVPDPGVRERLELAKRTEFNSALKMHSVLVDKLAAVEKTLIDASVASEALHRHISRGRFNKQIRLDRRLRVPDTIRAVNVARQNICKLHSVSKMLTKSVRDSEDDLVHLDDSRFDIFE